MEKDLGESKSAYFCTMLCASPRQQYARASNNEEQRYHA